MPSLAQRLIAVLGWGTAYAIIGAAVLLVAMPVVRVFLKVRPERVGLSPDGALRVQTAVYDAPADQGLSWRDTWRSATFWLMLGAFSLVGASVHACIIHMAALLADRGATAQVAALASSLAGAGILISRLGGRPAQRRAGMLMREQASKPVAIAASERRSGSQGTRRAPGGC
jgi:hypothetical protein